MTNYAQSAYGSSNPNAGYPANGDFDAWGGYAYPGGVPGSLLGTTHYTAKVTGQDIAVSIRKELVTLWQLAFQICDQVHGYAVWSYKGSEDWGPWGYENRAISGSNNPSGHSAALSVDINAPYNPYSYTFQSDMPPAMVADLESLGLYWGGRYKNQKFDPMHYGFCRAPSSVAGYVTRAQQLLGGSAPTPTPPTPTPPPSGGGSYTAPPGAYPYTSPDHYGDIDGDSHSHGGYYSSEQPNIKWIQTRINQLGYGTIGVDGIFGPDTIGAVSRWQAARHASTTSLPGEVWGDDWQNLTTDR